MDYKATDTEFTAVANAIRTKGGTSSQLVWPTGFVSAVNAIPSGGEWVAPSYAARVRNNNGAWTEYLDIDSAFSDAVSLSGAVEIELMPTYLYCTSEAYVSASGITSFTVRTTQDSTLNPAGLKAKIIKYGTYRCIQISQSYSGTVIIDSVDFDGKNTPVNNNAPMIWVQGAASVTVTNCSFDDCRGSALIIHTVGGCNSTVRNCKFNNCIGYATQSLPSNGSGLYINSEAGDGVAVIENCQFDGCSNSGSATITGGGAVVYLRHSDPSIINCILTNCLFKNCSSVNAGGFRTSRPHSLTNCQFINCSATDGGGMYISGDGTVKSVLKDVTFTGCTATGNGSALYSKAGSVDYDNLVIDGVSTTTTDKSQQIAGVYYVS